MVRADSGLPDDVALYNNELKLAREKGQSKWFAASWLYAECYLYATTQPTHIDPFPRANHLALRSYRHLRILFASTKHWTQFDPFATQKLDAFRSSAAGIYALAKSLQQRVDNGAVTDEKELEAEWVSMLEIDL